MRGRRDRDLGRIGPAVRPLDAIEVDELLRAFGSSDGEEPVRVFKLRGDSSPHRRRSLQLSSFGRERRSKSFFHFSLFLESHTQFCKRPATAFRYSYMDEIGWVSSKVSEVPSVKIPCDLHIVFNTHLC